MSQGNRVYGLDIVRAIAISTVLIGHSYYQISSHFKEDYLGLILAYDGVSIFFVLSGFLIGNILLKTLCTTKYNWSAIRNFWLRRWFRTLPAYLVVLTALVIVNQIVTHKGTVIEVSKYYFFIQSIVNGNPRIYQESWSLCVEEWFYISIPILFYISSKFVNNKRYIVLFLLISMPVVFACFRALSPAISELEWDVYVRKALIMRMDSIMYGFIGAYLSFYKHPIWEKKVTLFSIGLGIIAIHNLYCFIYGFNSFIFKNLMFPAQCIGTLLLLPLFSSIKNGSGVVYRSITFISTISYSLYLLNFTPFNDIFLPQVSKILHIPSTHTLKYDLIRFLLFFLWSFGASYMLYNFIEKPFMKLRDRKTKKEYKGNFDQLIYTPLRKVSEVKL